MNPPPGTDSYHRNQAHAHQSQGEEMLACRVSAGVDGLTVRVREGHHDRLAALRLKHRQPGHRMSSFNGHHGAIQLIVITGLTGGEGQVASAQLMAILRGTHGGLPEITRDNWCALVVGYGIINDK